MSENRKKDEKDMQHKRIVKDAARQKNQNSANQPTVDDFFFQSPDRITDRPNTCASDFTNSVVNLESWRLVWRNGFVPVISTAGLEALREALQSDDLRLAQGSTTTPPPLLCVQDWPVEAACALGFCGWQGERLETVGEVEEFFARICFEADQRLGEPAACRWFLNWFDDTPRSQMRVELLAEVERALAERRPVPSTPPGGPIHREDKKFAAA